MPNIARRVSIGNEYKSYIETPYPPYNVARYRKIALALKA
jgi:hypothetical protein